MTRVIRSPRDGWERRKEGLERPCRRSAQGERIKCGTVLEQESVLIGADDALLAPSAHDANRGLDGGAGEIGEFLPRQRHGDEETAVRLAPHFTRQLEEQAGKAWLDASARQLGEAIGQLDQALREAEQEAPDERGILLEQHEEGVPFDQ